MINMFYDLKIIIIKLAKKNTCEDVEMICDLKSEYGK